MNITNTVYLGEYDIKHIIADRYKVDVRNVPSKNLIDIVKAGGIDER